MLRKIVAPGSDSIKLMKEKILTIADHFAAWRDKLSTETARHAVGTMTHVSTQASVAALTFDDGPDPEFTPRLLDVLARHRAHATFFMLGENARKYPDIVSRVAAEGHAIGNHSWDHPSLPLLTRHERQEQIRACAAVIEPLGGLRLFRPPYGHQSLSSRLDALRLGYQVVAWNVVAEDWLDHDADWTANLLHEQIAPGSVVLLHDAIRRSMQSIPQYNRGPMIRAVDMALERLSDRFRFVTIPELLQCGRPQFAHWYQHPSPEMLSHLLAHPAAARSDAGSRHPEWSHSKTRV